MFEKRIKEFILQDAPASVIPHCIPVWKAKRDFGLETVYKLASNENPLGVSPKAMEAIRAALPQGYLYSDGSREAVLEKKIADLHGVEPSNIFISGGAAMVLKSICEVFIQPGDECIIPSPAYPPYYFWTFKYGGTIVEVPCRKEDQKLDIEGVLKAVTDKTKLVFLCNPNNPTSTAVSREDLCGVLDRLPGDVIAVVDEAYVDFTDDPEAVTMMPCLSRYPNMVVVRTFSKIYGMAGIRLGYGVACQEIVRYLDKAVDARGINNLAVEGGIAALDDREFRDRTRENNTAERKYLTKELTDLGYRVYDSQANFVWVDFHCHAAEMHDRLVPYGVIIRGDFPLARISIGLHEQNRTMIDALREIQRKESR